MASTKKTAKKNVKKEVKLNKEESKKVVKETKHSTKEKKCIFKNFKSWWLIGLLLPPLGLILFLLWKKNKKEAAKSAGVGALVAALLWMFFGLSFLVNTNAEPKEVITVAKWKEDFDNGEDIVTVIASSTCQHCKNLRPIITASSKKYGYKLYFFEADTLEEDDYNTLTGTIELKEYEGYVPYVFVIKNKEFAGSHTGEMSDSELTEFLQGSKLLN